jgi:hypothetical protein
VQSSSFTPVKCVRLGLSIEFPRPVDGTREETELETRLWPAVENNERAGEAGADVFTINGDWGRRGESIASRESRCASMI